MTQQPKESVKSVGHTPCNFCGQSKEMHTSPPGYFAAPVCNKYEPKNDLAEMRLTDIKEMQAELDSKDKIIQALLAMAKYYHQSDDIGFKIHKKVMPNCEDCKTIALAEKA